jgi:hypothetical protein
MAANASPIPLTLTYKAISQVAWWLCLTAQLLQRVHTSLQTSNIDSYLQCHCFSIFARPDILKNA